MYTHISILTSKRNFTLIYIKAISPSCRPPSSLVVDTRVVAEHHRQGSTPVKLIVKKKKGKWIQKVASILLKIGQQVAYR